MLQTYLWGHASNLQNGVRRIHRVVIQGRQGRVHKVQAFSVVQGKEAYTAQAQVLCGFYSWVKTEDTYGC